MYLEERRKCVFGKEVDKNRIVGLEKVVTVILLRNNLLYESCGSFLLALLSTSSRIVNRVVVTHITTGNLSEDIEVITGWSKMA